MEGRAHVDVVVGIAGLFVMLVLALLIPVPTDYQMRIFLLVAFVAASLLLARRGTAVRVRVLKAATAGTTVLLIVVRFSGDIGLPRLDAWLSGGRAGLRGEILGVLNLDRATRRGLVRARIASSEVVAAIAIQPRLDGGCWIQQPPRAVRQGEILEVEAEFGGREDAYAVWLLLADDATAFAGRRQLHDCTAVDASGRMVTKIGPVVVRFDRPDAGRAGTNAGRALRAGIIPVDAAGSTDPGNAVASADAQRLPRIVSPKEGDDIPRVGVDPPCSANGACTAVTVEGRVAPGQWPFVAVVALRSGMIWIQPAIPVVGSEGRFHAFAYLGDEKGGAGEWFTIVLLSHPDRRRFQERDILASLPSDCAMSEPVNVRRAR